MGRQLLYKFDEDSITKEVFKKGGFLDTIYDEKAALIEPKRLRRRQRKDDYVDC
jgi:hypothetical protein